MTDIKQAVQEGISVLDQHRPGWRDRIDLGTLDLENCYRCVLGQVEGSYVDGRKILAALDGASDHRHEWAIGHGFDRDVYPEDSRGDYEDLTSEWMRALGTPLLCGECQAPVSDVAAAYECDNGHQVDYRDVAPHLRDGGAYLLFAPDGYIYVEVPS
jgi:hypothetical protein